MNSGAACAAWGNCGCLVSVSTLFNSAVLHPISTVHAKTSYVKQTPLHNAATKGHKEVVELLIVAGVDVNAKNDEKGTPLHIAAYQGHKEIAELLIAAGVDVNVKDDDGVTPLDWASKRNHTETVDFLRKHGGKYGTIHTAAGGGDIEAVMEFLAAGADVNAKGNGGMTPLHYAAWDDHKEIAELLIAKGADINSKDDVGGTPLDVAILFEHPEIANLLRKQGGKAGEELNNPLCTSDYYIYLLADLPLSAYVLYRLISALPFP